MSTELRALIRDVAASMPDETTSVAIAEAVIEKARDELAGRFLLELVASVVTEVIGGDRRRSLSNVTKPVAKSRKQELIRTHWQEFLQTRVQTATGSQKLMRDCTIPDLEFNVIEREALIDEIRGQIDNFQKVIDAMRRFKCDVVGELSPELVNYDH